MSALDSLATTISVQAQGNRLIVAVAGPPGSGKTTISEVLQDWLISQHGIATQVVAMDGFHYDNAILEQRGLLPRKGAPNTFDVGGLENTLIRLASSEPLDVAVPVFDRVIELSRAGGKIISRKSQVILVEGNYLLLRDEPWCQLIRHFGFTVMIECNEDTLRERLIRRWLDHGFNESEAMHRAESNDLLNAQKVVAGSRQAHYSVSFS